MGPRIHMRMNTISFSLALIRGSSFYLRSSAQICRPKKETWQCHVSTHSCSMILLLRVSSSRTRARRLAARLIGAWQIGRRPCSRFLEFDQPGCARLRLNRDSEPADHHLFPGLITPLHFLRGIRVVRVVGGV